MKLVNLIVKKGKVNMAKNKQFNQKDEDDWEILDRNKHFAYAHSGYQAEKIIQKLNELVETNRELYKENKELKKEIEELENEIELLEGKLWNCKHFR